MTNKKKASSKSMTGKRIEIRCKGSRTVPYDKLKHFQGDLKEMSREDFEGLKSRILKHGWIAPVFVWAGHDEILDGHGRLLVLAELLKEGYSIGEIPVVDIEAKTRKEAAQILLAINSHYQKITGEGLYHFMSDMDIGMSDLEGLSLPDIDMDDFMDEFFKEDGGGKTDPDEVPEPPVIPKTKLGDLWILGEHRLLCGDSTNRADVSRLMGGGKAELCVTSPPYAVGKEYEVGKTFESHLKLLRDFADRCMEIIIPGGFIFTNFDEIAAQSHAGPLTGSKRQCIYLISKDYYQIFHEERKCDLYAQRIWYKPFNRLQQPFWTYKTSIPHYQEWEHIWTWRTPGGDGDRVYDWDISVHAVWDTRNEATDDKPLTRHVAAFPVGIPERAIKAHSDLGDTVYEPFTGSGTTIIVCEKLNRKCRAIELEPAYFDVILDRWANFTGKDPVREDGVKWSELKAEKPEIHPGKETFAQA